MVSLPLCHIDGKAGKGMVCSQSCHIYPHTRSHFYTFRFALVTDVESRPPDDDVVGNKIARRTAFIHRAAYLRHIFGVLWRYVSYTFRIRFDLLSVILLSATSGVGGSSSNCIFRSSAASSDFNCFSSSSFFHTFPAISYNCETSFSCTSFFALYWSMMDGILSNAFRKLRAAATGSAIASMQPMSYKDTDTTGEPVEHVTEPDKQIAHSALGDYGPFSVKYATKDFLSYGNKKFRI